MASSTPLCVVCDLSSITKPSIFWCFQCDGGFLSECKEHHSLSKETQKHCTLSVHEYQKKTCDNVKITDICSKHNEKYTFYCKKHACLCCGSCGVENHIECRDFDKLADDIQNTKFSNAFYEIKQSLVELSDNIQIIQTDRENNLKSLSKRKMQIEQDIKQTRITINNHLDIIQDDIMKKLNATEVKESKLISVLLVLLKENENEIIEYRKNIENIKQHATDLQTFISMKESVIDSENFKERDISYNVNVLMQDLPMYIKYFGEVKNTTKPCDVVLTSRKDKQAQIMLPHNSVANINLKLHKNINTIGVYIRGCCMLPDGKMAFTYYFDKAVRALNCNGIEDFAVILSTSAFDVAYIGHDNTLAVTSGNSAGKGIQLINPHHNSTIDIVHDEIPGYCYVAIFGDKIYHTNNQLNTVTCYDLQGEVKWKFQNENVLRCPCGVSVDNHGNVYVVGNSTNKVVVISADGQRHKEILSASEGLSLPCSLDYNIITNQLLVANLLDKPMIFTRT